MFGNKIKGQIKDLLQHFDKAVEGHIDTALKITTRIKAMLNSTQGDILLTIVAGLENKEIVKAGLNEILGTLSSANECKQCSEVGAKLSCFIQQLKHYDPKLQEALLQKLASLLTGYLDGFRMKQVIYDLYTQGKYSATK